MKQKNYQQEYKDNKPSETHGRTGRKGNYTELSIDDDGEVGYKDFNKREEIESITTGNTAYDWEKELIDAIDSDRETPTRAQEAIKYNNENNIEEIYKTPRIHRKKEDHNDTIHEKLKNSGLEDHEKLYTKRTKHTKQSRREINEVLQGMVY